MSLRDQIIEVQKWMGDSIIGQQTVIERLLIALFANGNVLMEGLPGTAKTRSIKTLSRLIQSKFSRVQFTPDLLPPDVTGSEISKDSSRQATGSLVLCSLVWLLLTALARPQWLDPPIERSIPTRDLLLLVDLSGSMDQNDFTNAAGASVNRLTAVKEVLGEFLARREGDRVGLIVFGNALFLQVPFTTDLPLWRQLLDETEVGMAGPRTALGDAIGLGIQQFENSDVPTKSIIALTDGNDTGSGVPLAEAAETGGKSFLAMNRGELAGIYEQLDQMETHEVKTVSHRPRRDLYFWPLAIALLLSLTAYGRKLFSERAVASTAEPSIRLRVNPRTFELEAIEP